MRYCLVSSLHRERRSSKEFRVLLEAVQKEQSTDPPANQQGQSQKYMSHRRTGYLADKSGKVYCKMAIIDFELQLLIEKLQGSSIKEDQLDF